jgi:hypothetical protein
LVQPVAAGPVGVVVSPGMEPIAVGIIETPANEGRKT